MSVRTAHTRAALIHRRQRAFSLVELLVVLAIIALLIAILLPSLNKAREQANRTRCLNNIRQIGTALVVYMNDFGDYPMLDAAAPKAAEAVDPATPVFFAASKSGLLALRRTHGIEKFNLTCPDGWASRGNSSYYESDGISKAGTAFMDYAYWPWRFALSNEWNVRTASFKYRQEKGTKIVVSDIVTDVSGAPPKVLQDVGYGNHGSNHSGALHTVTRTDGRGNKLGSANRIHGTGASVLFSDNHAEWYATEKLTQQVNGLCYPPVDRW
jgi:prepilin-type N-terminal cleavage/methylation domain-containing protein